MALYAARDLKVAINDEDEKVKTKSNPRSEPGDYDMNDELKHLWGVEDDEHQREREADDIRIREELLQKELKQTRRRVEAENVNEGGAENAPGAVEAAAPAIMTTAPVPLTLPVTNPAPPIDNGQAPVAAPVNVQAPAAGGNPNLVNAQAPVAGGNPNLVNAKWQLGTHGGWFMRLIQMTSWRCRSTSDSLTVIQMLRWLI